MNLNLWHGSHSFFAAFDDHYIGTGEGDNLGWGHRLAEHRAGGEFYASYMRHRDDQGFLYRVEVVIAEDELLNLDIGFRKNDPNVRRKVSRIFTLGELRSGLHIAYDALRQELGDELASRELLAEGIIALRAYENNNSTHGDTYLLFDASRIKIKEAYKLSITAHERSWLPLEIQDEIYPDSPGG